MIEGLRTIRNLHSRMQKYDIPHNYVKDRDGMRIDYPDSEHPILSFLENYASKGNEEGEDLLEIIDYTTEDYAPSEGYCTLADALYSIEPYEFERSMNA